MKISLNRFLSRYQTGFNSNYYNLMQMHSYMTREDYGLNRGEYQLNRALSRFIHDRTLENTTRITYEDYEDRTMKTPEGLILPSRFRKR